MNQPDLDLDLSTFTGNLPHPLPCNDPHTVTLFSCPNADTRYSALAFSIASAIFLPWFLLYVIAGDRILSPNVYHTLDATGLNVAGLGLPSG